MQLARIGRTALKVFWVLYGAMQLAAVFMPRPKGVPKLLKS